MSKLQKVNIFLINKKANLEALIFRDHGIADGNAEKLIWNGIPYFLPKHY